MGVLARRPSLQAGWTPAERWQRSQRTQLVSRSRHGSVDSGGARWVCWQGDHREGWRGTRIGVAESSAPGVGLALLGVGGWLGCGLSLISMEW